MRLTHAKLVLADQVVDASLTIEDGVIAGIDESGCGGEINCEGDYVIPGLIDLHTDSLERHYMPRPNVDWPPVSAAVIHDGNCVGHGVTTVFDSLSIGVGGADSEREAMLFPLLDGLAEAGRLGLLGADHRLHLRCEVTDDKLMDVLGRLVDRDGVSLVSLMDHTPGDRQYPDIEKYRANRKAWMDESEEEMEQSIADMLRRSREVAPSMREAVVRVAGERGLPIASHDDATQSHIEEAKTLGVTLAEFPTTTDAAKAAAEHGMSVIMGAPNLVRGGSYSGNVGAADVHAAGLLDILASDYVSRSMLEGAFQLHLNHMASLPEAINTVTRSPAQSVGMEDRGEIAAGKRADVLRVRMVDGHPHVRSVWVAGDRVR